MRKSAEFRRVLAKGTRHGGSCFLLYWVATPPPSRIGLTVSRKVGNAVTRNRIKRLMREYFRTSIQDWPRHREYVLIAKPNAGTLPNPELRADLERLFRRSLAGSAKQRP